MKILEVPQVLLLLLGATTAALGVQLPSSTAGDTLQVELAAIRFVRQEFGPGRLGLVDRPDSSGGRYVKPSRISRLRLPETVAALQRELGISPAAGDTILMCSATDSPNYVDMRVRVSTPVFAGDSAEIWVAVYDDRVPEVVGIEPRYYRVGSEWHFRQVVEQIFSYLRRSPRGGGAQETASTLL